MTDSSRPHPTRRLAALVAVSLLLAPIASSCGSDSDGAQKPGTTTAARGPSTSEEVARTTTTSPAVERTTSTEPEGGSTTTSAKASTSTTTADRTTTTARPTTGSSSSSEVERSYVDAIVAASTAEGNNELPLSTDAAECLAPLWVEVLGVERFTAAGLEPGDLTVGQDGPSYFDEIDRIGDELTSTGIVNSFTPCDVDLRDVVADILGGKDMTAAERACLVDAIPLGEIEASLRDALDGDDETASDLSEPVKDAALRCAG